MKRRKVNFLKKNHLPHSVFDSSDGRDHRLGGKRGFFANRGIEEMKRHYVGIVLLTAGFVCGLLVAPGFREATEQSGGYESSADHGSRRRQAEHSGQGDTPNSTSPIAALLDKAFSEQSEIRAMRDLMQAFSRHNKETAPVFAAYFTATPFSKSHFNHWRLFFSSWGTFDGPAALMYIQKRFDQPALQKEFYYSVLKSWNREIPSEVLSGAGDFLLTTRGMAGDLAVEFVRDLMASDPTKGMMQMVRLGDPEAVMEMAGNKLAQLAKHDVRSALEMLSGAEGEVKLYLTGQVLNTWSRTDPVGAANWLGKHGYPMIAPADLHAIAANYAKVDATAAFGWVNTLPDNLYGERLLETTSAAWAEADPAAATAWLLKLQPAPEYDPVVESLVRTIADGSPALALAEADSKIHDEARAQEIFFNIAMEWQRNRPEEFAHWLNDTTQLASEQKMRLQNREYHADVASGQEGVPALRQQEISDGRE